MRICIVGNDSCMFFAFPFSGSCPFKLCLYCQSYHALMWLPIWSCKDIIMGNPSGRIVCYKNECLQVASISGFSLNSIVERNILANEMLILIYILMVHSSQWSGPTSLVFDENWIWWRMCLGIIKLWAWKQREARGQTWWLHRQPCHWSCPQGQVPCWLNNSQHTLSGFYVHPYPSALKNVKK